MPKAVKVPQFDNLDDVMSKFQSTICYYDNKAVFVKSVEESPPNLFQLKILKYNAKESQKIFLDDPLFSYKNFNIGYANSSHTSVWWYRRPIKQYQQGLKKEQLGYVLSKPDGGGLEENFNFSRSFVAMLENAYPALENIGETLKNPENGVRIAAFHKDFALSWSELHDNFVLEFRGLKIGTGINGKLDQFRLVADFKYLAEALQEAIA